MNMLDDHKVLQELLKSADIIIVMQVLVGLIPMLLNKLWDDERSMFDLVMTVQVNVSG